MKAKYRDFVIPQKASLRRPALHRLCEIACKKWKDVKKQLPQELAHKLQQIERYGVGGTVHLHRIEIVDLALALDLKADSRQEIKEYINYYPQSASLFEFLAQDVPTSWLIVIKLMLATSRGLEGTESRLRSLRGVLKKIRRSKGLTQQAVAERTGWPQEKISEIENGRLRGRTAKARGREFHHYLQAIGCTEEDYRQIVEACGRGFTIGIND